MIQSRLNHGRVAMAKSTFVKASRSLTPRPARRSCSLAILRLIQAVSSTLPDGRYLLPVLRTGLSCRIHARGDLMPEPSEDLPRGAEDFHHPWDLSRFLVCVRLVDANGIRPEVPRTRHEEELTRPGGAGP